MTQDAGAGGGGNFRQPDFQNMPPGAHPRGSLDGHMLGALRHMSDQLGNILTLSHQQVQIAKEIPSDVGGTLSGQATIGNVVGAVNNKGWVIIASVKGQTPRYRSAFIQTPFGKFYSHGTQTVLGVIARLTFTAQDNATFQTIFDVPSNAIVHAACVSQNLTLEVMLTYAMYTTAFMSAAPAGYFDNPMAVSIDPTHSVDNNGLAASQTTAQAAITTDQALSPNPFNSATRHVNVVLGAAGTSVIPIPVGAVAVTLNGPTDLGATIQTELTYNAPESTPTPARTTVILPNGSQAIGISSTTGGLVTAIFTLGF